MAWLGGILGSIVTKVLDWILSKIMWLIAYGSAKHKDHKKNKKIREDLENAKTEDERKKAADQLIGGF